MKTTVTNISKARQGIHTPAGLVWLKQGETRDLDLDEASHARVIELAKLLRVGDEAAQGVDLEPEETGNGAPAPVVTDTFDAMTDDELSALYHDKFGKAPHHKAKRETIIEKLRGE